MTSGVFALSKIAAAIEKSIRQIKPEMELSYGSWGLNYTVLGDIFFPPAYGMIPLDYSTVLNDKNNLSMLAEVGKRRKLYPIVWAHHDDHRYNGRPYIPFSSFNSLLHNMNADGFGIIHWKTHPLDLYFANNARQVWERTENESYYQTICRFSKSLSKEPQKPFDGFLQDWYHHAPMFGRETSDNFLRIDKPYNLDGYSSALEAVEKAKDRVAILEEVNVSRLTKAGKRDFQYHRSYESFLMSFFNDHEHAYQANALLKQDRVEEAREQIKQAHPAQTIQTYAGLIKAHGPTRGELGIVISLNLRWYPDFVDLQQRLRIKPIRISFQPTSHDPLSQGTGHYSYLMDENQKLWLAQGTKELGFEKIISNKKVLKSPRDSYALLSSTLSIPLRTMRNAPLSSGSYRIELLGASKKPPSANVTIRCRDGKRNIFNKTFVPTEWNQQVTLGFDSSLSNQPAILQIDPQGQPLALSGIVLTPVPSDKR